MRKYYITTSLPYVNTPGHLGHALEFIQADVLARYHRIFGEDVFFLTGTDEHGQKVVRAAEKAGQSPKEFTDEISRRFRELTDILNVSNDDFIRTTDQKKHWPTVQRVWLELKRKGDVYKKNYRGLYCSGCEAFITKKDLADGKCVIHQKEPEVIEEENYFFKLSKYSNKIKKILEKDKIRIIPESRKNEMLSFAKQGLEDVSFSRPRKDLEWGIPVPDDDSQTIYVWADALSNYLSAIGYDKESSKFKKYWPADVHFIGKDIQKFHCLIWPGILLSLGLPLPKKIFVHGFINVAGQKMSKSLGNVVDPFELVEKYGTDAVRYFLLREIPSTEDGDFTYEKFKNRYNADLASGLGNLVSRVIKHPQAPNVQKIEREEDLLEEYRNTLNVARKQYKYLIEKFDFSETLAVIWQLNKFCDQKIEKTKLWEKGGKQIEVIASLLFVIGQIAELLEPFLPATSEKILKQLKTRESKPLFPRI